MIDRRGNLLERSTFFIVFLLVIIGVYLSRWDLSAYEGFYVREDGFIEYLTLVPLFLGFVASIHRAKILRPFRNPFFIFVLYVFALTFLFGLGEEISWGQRILKFESPPFFRQYNTQGEFNLHNLRFGDFKINRYIFGTFLGICIAIYFLILPIFYGKIEKVKEFCNRAAIPIPKLYHICAYLILFLLVQLIESPKKGEILEFGGCWIVFLMFLAPKNREVFSRKTFDR